MSPPVNAENVQQKYFLVARKIFNFTIFKASKYVGNWSSIL